MEPNFADPPIESEQARAQYRGGQHTHTRIRNALMAKTTIGLSIILIVMGVIGWLVTGMASWTALIPSILGVVLLICGIIGLSRPKIGIHIALVVALLGIIGTFMNVLKLGDLFAGTAERPAAVIVSTITFVLLIVYIVAGVRSFIAARRGKNAPGRDLA